MTKKKLLHRDTGVGIQDFAAVFRFALPLFLALVAIQVHMFSSGTISGFGLAVLLFLDPFVAGAVGYGIWLGIGGMAERFVSIAQARGNIAPTKQYSEQDALLVRGQVAEAIASYRALITRDRHDLDARLRLAALLAKDGGDSEGAERVYLEVRALGPTPPQTTVLSNGLIDLYRDLGRRDDLKLELGRFARRFPNSRESAAARAYLERLNAEDLPADSA